MTDESRVAPLTKEQVIDLWERLEKASLRLQAMGDDAGSELHKVRVRGKAAGVRLALSYLEEYLRQNIEPDSSLCSGSGAPARRVFSGVCCPDCLRSTSIGLPLRVRGSDDVPRVPVHPRPRDGQ